MYEHFIITRFNLRKKDWQTAKNNQLVLTEAWMERRFTLFEDFCFPSVKGQDCQNFTWLVFFDTNTPGKYKDRILGLKLGYPNFKPIFVNGMENFFTGIQSEICKSNADYLITSRLDNDDCLAKNFTKTVQAKFRPEKKLALDFPDGYTLQISPHFRLGKKRQLYNPFISLIEVNDQPKSVWQKERHGQWSKERNLIRINGECVWLSVIHQENKVNEYTAYLRVNDKILDNFAIAKKQKLHLQNELQNQPSRWGEDLKNYMQTQLKCIYSDLKRAIRVRK